MTVRDVSCRGMRVELAAGRLRPGDDVWFEIPEQRGFPRILGLGEVRWADGRRVGVSIDAMFPHHRWRFERIVREQLAG
jgi:hypothetical protein